MSHRTPGQQPTPQRRQDPHRLPAGLPSYRPVRSPLVSMGPSLVEEQRRLRAWRRGGVMVVLLCAVAVALAWLVVLLGREVVADAPVARVTASAPSVPVGRPAPQALARVKPEGNEPTLKLQLPIRRRAVTAIGYNHLRDTTVLVLEPEGSRANVSWGERVFRRFLATEQASPLRYFLLSGGGEPNVVNVGAAAGTDTYAPISGTVLAIADNVINDEARGKVVQLQPLGDAETVVVVRNIDPAPDLAVGQTVSEGATLLGYVRDMSDGTEKQPLARYTHDDGSNVELSVRRVQLDVGA